MQNKKINLHAQILGKLGGIASAKALTPKQRSERSKKAVEARIKKYRK